MYGSIKKILCVSLALGAAAFGFSQELKFDGYVNSGLGLVITSKEDTDPQVMAYGLDSQRFIGRFRLNGAFTNADKNAGANFRLQVQGKGIQNEPANLPALAFGYGWFKPLDMLTVKAGLVDDSTWQTGDAILAGDQGEGAGMLVRVSPVTGLDFGVGAYAASYGGGSSNNFFSIGPLPESLRWDAIKYTFNAAYTLDKVFRAAVSGRTWNLTGNETTPRVLGELRLLAIEHLTAIAVIEADKVDEDFSDTGLINCYETLAYQAGDLGFGLNAAQYLNNAKDAPALRFNGWLNYALNEGGIVPRIDLDYFLGGQRDGSNCHRHTYKPVNTEDDSIITARPSVKFNFGSKTSFEIGDAVYYDIDGRDGADDEITNVLYFDVVIKF
jgi:hypothetical protein